MCNRQAKSTYLDPVTRNVRKFAALCFRVEEGDLVNITRLWNYADNMHDTERYWDVLRGAHPEAYDVFNDHNSIRFTYHEVNPCH